jgi:hypothetical protein
MSEVLEFHWERAGEPLNFRIPSVTSLELRSFYSKEEIMKLNYTCEDYKALLSKPRAVIEDEETLEEAFVIPKGDYYLIKAFAEEALEAREMCR